MGPPVRNENLQWESFKIIPLVNDFLRHFMAVLFDRLKIVMINQFTIIDLMCNGKCLPKHLTKANLK